MVYNQKEKRECHHHVTINKFRSIDATQQVILNTEYIYLIAVFIILYTQHAAVWQIVKVPK